MKKHIFAILTAIAVGILSLPAQEPDPLPGVKLPTGPIKNLGAQFIKELVGTGVNLTATYLMDHSNASFQLERAFWSEGKSHLYEDYDTQTYRRIDWINKTRANYLTETLWINRTTGLKRRSDPDETPFSDYEVAKRYWRSFFKDGNKYQRIEAWFMQIKHRLRNTYYKPAVFPSKQMSFPATVKVYRSLSKLPSVVINGINHNFRPGSYDGHVEILMPSKLGVSEDFVLVNRQNTKLQYDDVPELWVPGEDDN